MSNVTFYQIKTTLAGLALAGSLGLASAQAQVAILDQIGTSAATVDTTNAYSSQFFETANAAFNIGAVDNFTAAGSLLKLTQVQAAFQAGNGFTSYSGVTGWSVEIYSSQAAATGNLIGNIASVNLTPAQVTVDTTFGPAAAFGALISLPVNITLPAVGTYYLSVLANNSFATNGQTYVDRAAFGTTQTNAFQVNPGGGFAFPGNTQPVNPVGDLAYRIFATPVPEPSTYAMMGVGAIALGATLRLRRRVA